MLFHGGQCISKSKSSFQPFFHGFAGTPTPAQQVVKALRSSNVHLWKMLAKVFWCALLCLYSFLLGVFDDENLDRVSPGAKLQSRNAKQAKYRIKIKFRCISFQFKAYVAKEENEQCRSQYKASINYKQSSWF